MAMTINNNLASLYAQNSLTSNQNLMATAVQRLSSGLRINSARDGGSDLAMSQSLMSQIVGTNQGISNLNNATNLLQTADTGLSVIQDALLRMKQVAAQGMDPTLYSTNNFGAANLVSELKELNNVINSLAASTKYNGISLLSSGPMIDSVNSKLKAGIDVADEIPIDITSGGNLGSSSTFTDNANAVYNISAAILDTENSNYHQLPGSYVLSNDGNKLYLTPTVNGVQQAPDVYTVQDVPVGSTASKNINFSKTGISFSVTPNEATTVASSGEFLAGKIQQAIQSFTIDGKTARISAINVSGALAGSYELNSDGATLTLTKTTTGKSADVTLPSIIEVNKTNLIDFASLGIQIQVIAYPGYSDDSNQIYSGDELASAIANINGGSATFNVISSGVSKLSFPLTSNSTPVLEVNTSNVMTNTYGSSPMKIIGDMIPDVGSQSNYLASLNKDSLAADWQAEFSHLADAVDEAINYISSIRSSYGAKLNAAAIEVGNLQSQSLNLQATRSDIVDTDFASETAKLTKMQIMQQAGIAVLAQANQNPSLILQLLKSPLQQSM